MRTDDLGKFIKELMPRLGGRKWTASRRGARVITLDQGLELGRMKNEWRFGEVL
jgi:hypothetical protein